MEYKDIAYPGFNQRRGILNSLGLMDRVPRIDTLPPGKLMDIYRQLARDIRGPPLNVMVPPGFALADLCAAGYAMVSMPMISQQAAGNAMYTVLTEALTNATGARYFKENTQFVSSPRKIMDLMKVGAFRV